MKRYQRTTPASRLLIHTLFSTLLMATTVVSMAQVDEVKIWQIQGAVHISPFAGEQVETIGIVTRVDFRGFYLQDANGDDNDNLRYYAELEIVHVNVDFARVDDSVASDHEPLVGRFYLAHDDD